jgi:hypothetical protein
MSPEQARAEHDLVGPASDIYSLGVILYELLAGRRPYEGPVAAVLGQILYGKAEPPSKLRPEVPAALEAICFKAMAREVKDRYGSMRELADALTAYLRGLDQDAPPKAAAAGPAAAAPAAGESDSQRQGLTSLFAALAEQHQDTARRMTRTQKWLGAGVLGVLALFGILFFARTSTATVLIQIDVDLTDKALSFFLDAKPISAEALAAPVQLTVGDHHLVVKRGEAIVKQMRFRVQGGRNPKIVVEEETPPEPAAPPASEPTPGPRPLALVFDHPLSKSDTLDRLYCFFGQYGGQAVIVPGSGLQLRGGHTPTMVWARPFLGDHYRVQFDVQLKERGWAGWVLNGPGYGNSPNTGYGCRFDKTTFSLRREGVEAQALALPRPIVPGEWATVQVEVSTGKITVTVNGLPIPQFSDAEPLTGPLHGWFGLTSGEAFFRNLRLWSSAPNTSRERQLSPPATEKPLANGKLLYELKLAAGGLGSEWWKSQPSNVAVENGTLVFSGDPNGLPGLILSKPLNPELACEVEFEYPAQAAAGHDYEAVNLSVQLWFAKKAPQVGKDCDGGWLVYLPQGDGQTRVYWEKGGKDAREDLIVFGAAPPPLASTPYYAPVSRRKYLARIETHRDSLRVFLDGGLLLTAKRPGSAAPGTMPIFLGLRQYFLWGGSKVHAVRVYQIGTDSKARL